MKLFKILFISIISIFIFQSQIYGINLRCDFKKRLFDINKNQDNRVTCGWLWGKSYCEKKGCNICEVRDSRQEDSVLDGYWISEVVIKDEDVVIRYELSDFDRSRYTNKEKRDWREKQNRRVFKLENVVHHKNFIEERKFKDRYVVVINETWENWGKKGNSGKVGLYTLFFDNLSKKSILTDYNSHKLSEGFGGGNTSFTNSYFGECEEI